jgi:uncharacterized protein YrzB (UPF0473 family)
MENNGKTHVTTVVDQSGAKKQI